MNNVNTLILSLIAATFHLAFVGCNSTSTPPDDKKPNTFDTIVTKTGDIALVLLKSGTFRMGNSRIIPGREFSNEWQFELPQRKVTLTRDFYVSKYEVTEAQWQAVMGARGFFARGANYPQDSVTFYQVVDFCNKLSQLEGLIPVYSANGPQTKEGKNVIWDTHVNGYRMLSEAEWEYACRGGTTTDTYNGDLGYGSSDTLNRLSDIAWFKDNSGSELKNVGLKIPNQFGLYDMLGNAIEYCYDLRSDSVDSLDKTDYVNKDIGYGRCVRGGQVGSPSTYTRSSVKHVFAFATTGNKGLGFRVARFK